MTLSLRLGSFVLAAAALLPAAPKAKNVILFLADAGGTSTIHAASVHGHGATRKLFVQSMPHIGLSDTSTPSNWVSDSAAGMTAIVTGTKTHNGVISMGPDTVRGKQDGTKLKTILEYAEEHGLSTGVITNVAFYDATPAACYAQANDRRGAATILKAFLNPRFGNGVDVLIGSGRPAAAKASAEAGFDFFAEAAKKGYKVTDSPADVNAQSPRLVAVFAPGPFALAPVLRAAIEVLSKNPKGYFLMVEWDAHTDNPANGLSRLVEFDKAIRETAERVDKKKTLLLFTADHSFDLRMIGGKPGQPLALPATKEEGASGKFNVRVNGSHAAEEVLVAAQGPGADRVKGYLDNTDLFGIMLSAFGWKR
ncbi:MAG: alkaline phosphatase [Bryobacterales bacterium]|nr:alkaline phosphatase [Bryobacterales bacterium]